MYGMSQNCTSFWSNPRFYERIPVCSACQAPASGSTDPLPPLPPPRDPPMPGENLDDEWDPEVVAEEGSFNARLREAGSIPCKIHGMDHLSRDPDCEFCKRALGPMYRHLKGRYGTQIADYTPTLSFDFSGPLPLAVTGAKILMVFVWPLHEVRLLCAFALVHRTKENVLACLQSLIADLNTLTGGSKPLVARVHSDQAKEFLSRPAMEWLKEKGIRQTFTSTYASQANGVAERWLNLVKTKATALLASRHLPTAFWCYAVAWVAQCYNLKVLGQTPKKNLPEFGQLLLVRVNRDNKLQERGILGIMASTYLEIANGVIVLSIKDNTIQESYTAPRPQLPAMDQKIPLKYPHSATLQRSVDGWEWYTSNVGQLMPHCGDIEPEDIEDPIPAIGGARFYTWAENTSGSLNPPAQARDLTSACSDSSQGRHGITPCSVGTHQNVRLKVLLLPKPLAKDAKCHAEEQDQRLWLAMIASEWNKKIKPNDWMKLVLLHPLGGGGTFFRLRRSWANGVGEGSEQDSPEENDEASSEVATGSGRIVQPDSDQRMDK